MMKKLIALFTALTLFFGLCACTTAQSEGKDTEESQGPTWQGQYDLGVRYLSEGNYKEAILAFTAAIEIDPKQAPAYVGRGDAYVLSGETETNLSAAKADYERAIELDGTIAEAYLGLADVYIRQGDYEKALEILRQGLEKTGNDQGITDKLAEMEQGNIRDSSGLTRRLTVYGSAGEITYWHDYTYDAEWRLASVTSYSGTGEQTGHVDLTYTENGDPLDSYSWYYMGAVGRTSYEYNGQGQISKLVEYTPEGELSRYYLYQYDGEGNQVCRQEYSSDGKLNSYIVMEYDDRKQVVKSSNYWGDGTLLVFYIYEYNKDGEMTKTSGYNADGSPYSCLLYLYDSQGYITAEEQYDGNGNLSSYQLYLYDDQGNMTAIEQYDGDGNLIDTITYN